MTKSDRDGVFEILASLRRARISHSLQITRDDAITILAVVPGQRWEIDVHRDGNVDVEVFSSGGDIHSLSRLEELIQKHAE